MTKHIVRIIHKPKRSHHKAKPEPHCELKLTIDSSPPFHTIFFRQLIDEACQTLAAGYRESALLHLTALRKYRLDYKYFECV
jgi:hypothetical protein